MRTNWAVLYDLGLAHLFTAHPADAVVWFRRCLDAKPDFGRAHFSLGRAYQEMGDDEAALHAYADACKLAPGLMDAHAHFGNLLCERGRRTEAVSAYERAFESSPNTTSGRICQATALDLSDRRKEAEDLLRALIASDGSDSRPYALLGKILKETGRFDEAATSFERAVELDAAAGTAYHGLVSVRKTGEAERPRLARILERLDTENGPHTLAAPSLRQRMMLHFAAGKAFDDLADFPNAMVHFHAGNRIRRQLSSFDLTAVEQRVERLVQRYDRKFFASHAEIGTVDNTPILILGMPRSGTTLVERIVSSHRDVEGRGELDFWSEHGPGWAHAEPARLAQVADKLRADYMTALRGRTPQAARATDKMPFNFFWIGLVHLVFPNARILHCRRHPLDTCLSIYTTVTSATWGFSSNLSDLASYYRLYLRLMDHWRSVIPPDRLLDVEYESLVGEPEANIQRLVEFCGLPWDSACLRPDENDDPIRTASLWQARQPIYRTSVSRWRRYEPWIGELLRLLDESTPCG